jgi:hypothetical protein
MPDNFDPIDALLRQYATERKAFAARVPNLHPVDIRLLADEARKTWKSRSAAAGGQLNWLAHLRQALSPTPWHLAAAAAIVLLLVGVALRPGTPVYQSAEFAMVVDGYRGEPEIPAGFDRFTLDVDLNKRELTLKFANGYILKGTLKNEADKATQGEPTSYTVKASGTNAQASPLGFRGVLTPVIESASPQLIKAASLRGVVTDGTQEYSITANVKQ